jgi:prophage regulatory protein
MPQVQSRTSPVPVMPPLSGDQQAIGGKPSRLIRLPEVKLRVGLARSTIYRKMEEGTFPRSRSISAKCAVWVEVEVQAWIDDIVTRAG